MGTFAATAAIPYTGVNYTDIFIAEDSSYYYLGFKAGGYASSLPSTLSKVNFPSPVAHYYVPSIVATFPFPVGMFSNYQVDLKTTDGEVIAYLSDSNGNDNIPSFVILSKKTLTLQLQ